MEWEKLSVELADTLEMLVSPYTCTKKPMFGCPVFFVNDNMFAGVKGGMFFIRLSGEDRNSIMQECGDVTSFEPRPGMIMKEYVTIPDNKLSDEVFISRWLARSHVYMLSLPPKEKKERKTKKK